MRLDDWHRVHSCYVIVGEEMLVYLTVGEGDLTEAGERQSKSDGPFYLRHDVVGVNCQATRVRQFSAQKSLCGL